MNENAAAFNRVLSRSVQALPDSISDRKDALADILQIMPTKHPLRIQVSEMFNALEYLERHQTQLALDFKKQGGDRK